MILKLVFILAWITKGKDKRFFVNTSLKELVSFLINNCYFYIYSPNGQNG